MRLPLLLAFLAASPAGAADPIVVTEVVRETPDGPLRGVLARVDLRDPRVSFAVTAPVPTGEAVLRHTDAWAREAGVALAVNANFFARVAEAEPRRPWTDGETVDVIGLSVSEGRVVSPPRPRQPVLLVDETGGRGADTRCPCRVKATIAGARAPRGVEEAVGGMGPRGRRPGTLLLERGENRGATAEVAAAVRHPRTAAGVTRDGRTLLLLVVDGRRPGWSIGATLPEVADLLREAGAADAVALDGGGSSVLWFRAPGEPEGRVMNRPSDGRVRPVANHLGVRVRP